MSEEVASALRDIAQNQVKQISSIQAVQDDVNDIKDSIRRIHSRLDDTAKETTINSQSIKHIIEDTNKCNAECEKHRKLIWDKMGEKKREAIIESQKNMKIWIYGAFATGAGSLFITILGLIFKSKILG